MTILKIVAMGDSITAGLSNTGAQLTPYTSYLANLSGVTVVNKGIGAQRTDQMLARFQTDVIDEAPDAVIILGGTNDFYHNTAEQIISNLLSMYELAILHSIIPVCCLTLPCNALDSSTSTDQIIENRWITNYAENNNFPVVDLFAPFQDPGNPGHMNMTYSIDGTHPIQSGYELMGNIIYNALFNPIVTVVATGFDFNLTGFNTEILLDVPQTITVLNFRGLSFKCWQEEDVTYSAPVIKKTLFSGAVHATFGKKVSNFPMNFQCYTETKDELLTIRDNLFRSGILSIDGTTYSNCYISSFGKIHEVVLGSGKYTYVVSFDQADIIS